MSAKSELLERLKYLNAALQVPDLVDQGIALDDRNGAANILRKGLGIVAFNILEDYVKSKAIESLQILSNSRVLFSNLTDHLQYNAVYGALNALSSKAAMQKKEADTIQFIQNEALKIYSTSKPTFELSKLTLVSKGSNITDGEITDFIKAFGITGGWAKLKEISDLIGGGLPDLCQSYQNIAFRRHNAAHAAAYNYSLQWLLDIKNEIIAIAASIDILISARCRQITSKPTLKIDSHDINEHLKFRFLESNGLKYRETVVRGGRTRKSWNNLLEGVNTILPTLSIRKEFLIILNSSKRIEDWYC